MLPSIFDRGKLRTSRLCCSLSHLTVHTEMTGNTIERLMKLLCERLELMWLSLVHIRIWKAWSKSQYFSFSCPNQPCTLDLIYLNLVILLQRGLRHMRFWRADALLFFRVQNSVDEKFRGILVVCYENVPGHPYYSTFILREITHREM